MMFTRRNANHFFKLFFQRFCSVYILQINQLFYVRLYYAYIILQKITMLYYKKKTCMKQHKINHEFNVN